MQWLFPSRLVKGHIRCLRIDARRRKNDTAVVLDNKYGRTATLYQQDEYLPVYIRFSLR